MPKIFKVSDKKAYQIEAIEIDGQKLISVRQMYKTEREPDEWKVGYKGITFEARGVKKLAQYMVALADNPETEFTHVEIEKKEARAKKKLDKKGKSK